MKKRSRAYVNKRFDNEPISWLPVDSRLIPDIFSFSHVKGNARIFLLLEIILSILVVIGTFLTVYLQIFFYNR